MIGRRPEKLRICASVQAAFDAARPGCYKIWDPGGGAVAQLEARLDGIEEVVGSNPIGSTISINTAWGHCNHHR